MQMTVHLALVLGLLVLCSKEDHQPSHHIKAASSEAVGRVLAGEIETANAAWWGFDAADSTEALQASIDSGAGTVIVPFMGDPWIVRPIRLRGSLTLLFEPGVVVQAKRGEFKRKNDSLFRAEDVSDLILRGYGARLVMWKEDYQSEAYEKAEWRMGVSLRGCSRVRIEGLRIEKTGGDGVYLGATEHQPFCRDILIRDVACVDNHRQGISVISAENLLVENCLLAGTHGTAPQAGIDLEPNKGAERLVDCVVRNCVIENNSGAGILVYLGGMASRDAAVEPVSIVFENCLVRGGKRDGIHVAGVLDHGPDGTIEFRNCTVMGSAGAGIAVAGKSADRARVRFMNCSLANVFTADGAPGTPLHFGLWGPDQVSRNGGVELLNCCIVDSKDRPVASAAGARGQILHDVHGTLFVRREGRPAPLEWGVPTDAVDLAVVSLETR